jgi:hypothetical protein
MCLFLWFGVVLIMFMVDLELSDTGSIPLDNRNGRFGMP